MYQFRKPLLNLKTCQNVDIFVIVKHLHFPKF